MFMKNDFEIQILASISDAFSLKLIWDGCQFCQVNIGSGYGLVPLGN